MTVATLPRELVGVDPRAAAAELLRRSRARTRLIDFTLATFPEYRPSWHHRVVAHFLDLLLERKIPRLIVNMPPQNGKSELGSRQLPALALGRNPDARVIQASYAAELASSMNVAAQRVIDSPSYAQLFPETRLMGGEAEGRWRRTLTEFEVVGRRGSMFSAGVGGGITGRGFDVGIIDDPVKNREEAESETVRDAQWDWYTSTFRTRASDTAVILVMMTRWHEDDLAGRLLEKAKTDERADQWVVLSLPAISYDGPRTMTLSLNGEDVIEEIDPRAVGDALWADKFPLDWLHKTEASVGIYDWAALYDQTPSPRKGGMFERDWFKLADVLPADDQIIARVRYWDKAGTDGGGAYSVGVKMSRTFDGVFLIEDVVRAQLSAGRRNALMKQTARLDGVGVEIWAEQEPGSGGKESGEITIRELAGYDVHVEPSTGDKVTRARPLSAQAEAGNVHLLLGPWIGAYLDEITAFPTGHFKDQVDASSGAFNKLALAEPDEAIELTPMVEISPY